LKAVLLPPISKKHLKMTKTKHFDFLLSIRKNLLTYLDNLTPEQLGYIPIGFSNNIFWNIASWHLSSKDCTFKGRNLPSKGIVTQYS